MVESNSRSLAQLILEQRAKSNSLLRQYEAEPEELRRKLHEGLNCGPARPWTTAEMKRQGRKRLAARKAAE